MSDFDSRRSFLRGMTTGAPTIRPPWACPESLFVDKCTRCHACNEACPTQIIVIGDGGYPAIDFSRGECTFCTDCAKACEANVFRSTQEVPWELEITVGTHCFAANDIYCMSCIDVCPAQAIELRYTRSMPMPHVDITACTACGACVNVCPATAISLAPHRPEASA